MVPKKGTAKKKDNTKPVGLTPAHYGFRVGENYFPPSEFAIGWIAATSPGDLEKILDSEVDKILQGKYKRGDIPTFYDLVMQARKDKKRFNLDDLREMAIRTYGTAKIIDRELVMPVNSDNAVATISRRETVSMKVDTRRKRSAKKPAYSVTLFNPFIFENNDIFAFRFEGGTLHLQKNLAKDTHWSKGLKQERNFVRNLGKIVEEHARTAPHLGKITAQDVIRDYTEPLRTADYSIAAALIKLNDIVAQELGKVEDSKQYKGLRPDTPSLRQVPLPFDFSKTPHYAFEAFIMSHSSGKRANEKSVEKRLFDVDRYLTGKKGFVTPLFNALYNAHLVKKEVKLANRKFLNSSWALMQAWEEHFYKEGRTFSGYALEFAGTSFQTVSVVFDDKIYKDRDFSVRIIYDDNIGLPYVMYKSFIQGQAANAGTAGLQKHPLAMVNLPRDVDEKKYPHFKPKTWYEQDPRTGKLAHCTIFPPTQEIYDRASELSRNAGKGLAASELKSRYIANRNYRSINA